MIIQDTSHLVSSRSITARGKPWGTAAIKLTTGGAHLARRRSRKRIRHLVGSGISWIGSSLVPVRSFARAALRRLTRSRRRASEFSAVQVAPTFSLRNYKATFAELQLPSSSGKLLDLVPARLVCVDMFAQLADAWTAEREAVPSLGILLTFERWVILRDAALIALRPLAARGIRVDVFYAEQVGHLGEWFACSRVVPHNVGAAIATLSAEWHPTTSWPLVLDTLRRLAHAYAARAELPALLTRAAGLALSCGGAAQATLLAQEALFYLPETASATRCQALRELGTALICQGIEGGVKILDQAFAMAAECKAPDVGASALCHSGLCALNHGDFAGAERRFRRVIDLLPAAVHRPELLGVAHHNLGVALMHQRKLEEAEHHARTALALRPDPCSHLAEEDRILLAELDRLRHTDSESSQLALDAGTAPPRRLSEADA